MSGKWTKGPWRYSEGVDGKKRVYGEEGREIVRAMSTIGPRRPSPEERAANAQLIAAAPELAEALIPLADMGRIWDNRDNRFKLDVSRSEYEAILAALRKAGVQ